MYISVWLYKSKRQLEEDDMVVVVHEDGTLTDYWDKKLGSSEIEWWFDRDRSQISCVYHGIERDIREIVERGDGIYDRFRKLEIAA